MGRKRRCIMCALLFLCILSPPAYAAKTVIASGMPVGVRMTAKGVVVCATEEIQSKYGGDCPAKEAGLRAGDILYSVNGENISSSSEFAQKVHKGGGNSVVIEGERDNVEIKVTVQPVKSTADNEYHLGLLVRDSMAGIGTVTYIDLSDGSFGALGHAVTEIDSGTILPLRDGSLMPASVVSITKGKRGNAGELTGAFQLETNLGEIDKNTPNGIFGIMRGVYTGQMLEIAQPNEINIGKAQILCCINGIQPKKYDIQIERINRNSRDSKSMAIRVIDKELLEKTGGIVQGMSGSPIIQNGKLVGAVTHVLLNNPEKGYGIFITAMMDSGK